MSPSGRLAAWWDEFFFLPVDVRFADAFRIAYAALLFLDCAGYLPFVNMWWGEQGAIPFDVARTLIDPDTFTIFTWLPRNDTLLWVCFGIFAAQTVALLVGYKCRFQAVCVYIWLVSFQHRLHLINDGEDTVLRIFGFLLIFMPIGRWLSNDSGARLTGPVPKAPAWALRLVQFQTALVVFCAGWEKWLGADWPNGTAMYYVTRLNDLFGRFPVPDAMLDSLSMLKVMSWSTLGLEIALPILVWFRPITLPVVIVALGFHLTIDYQMNLFLFQWLMVLGWLSFLATADLGPWMRRFRRRSTIPAQP